MRRNARGFMEFTTFADDYGARVRVVESSAVGRPYCWVFIAGGMTANATDDNTAGAHLTRAQAKRLITALERFLAASAAPPRRTKSDHPTIQVGAST